MNRWTILVLVVLASCSNPQPGPDKTVAGGLLGAGWGAGAGAIVGNQLNNTGPGIAVGAGVGLVEGLISGASSDVQEGAQLKIQRDLTDIRAQNKATSTELRRVQRQLDQALSGSGAEAVHQVYFDPDSTSLRQGSVDTIHQVADSFRTDPRVRKIRVVGNSDDGGTADYQQKVAEARAKEVAAALSARGISSDQIQIEAVGATKPMTSNMNEAGRQLNRRVDIFAVR